MQVETFVEMFAPMGEIVQQMGRSGTRPFGEHTFVRHSPIGANRLTNSES